MRNQLYPHPHPHHPNQPVSICPSWCVKPLPLLLAIHRGGAGACLWFPGRNDTISGDQLAGGWGGIPRPCTYLFSIPFVHGGSQCLSKNYSIASFQFQEVLASNETNRCMKFNWHSGFLCYSAVTSQILKTGWLTTSVSEIPNQLLSFPMLY